MGKKILALLCRQWRKCRTLQTGKKHHLSASYNVVLISFPTLIHVTLNSFHMTSRWTYDAHVTSNNFKVWTKRLNTDQFPHRGSRSDDFTFNSAPSDMQLGRHEMQILKHKTPPFPKYCFLNKGKALASSIFYPFSCFISKSPCSNWENNVSANTALINKLCNLIKKNQGGIARTGRST